MAGIGRDPSRVVGCIFTPGATPATQWPHNSALLIGPAPTLPLGPVMAVFTAACPEMDGLSYSVCIRQALEGQLHHIPVLDNASALESSRSPITVVVAIQLLENMQHHLITFVDDSFDL